VQPVRSARLIAAMALCGKGPAAGPEHHHSRHEGEIDIWTRSDRKEWGGGGAVRRCWHLAEVIVKRGRAECGWRRREKTAGEGKHETHIYSYLSWSEGISLLLDRLVLGLLALALVLVRTSKASNGDRKSLWERYMMVPCREQRRGRTCGECFSFNQNLSGLEGIPFLYILQGHGHRHMACMLLHFPQVLGEAMTLPICRRIETCCTADAAAVSKTQYLSLHAILPSSLDSRSPLPL
jgi:hypothetical protein